MKRYTEKRGARVIEEWPKRLPFNKVDVLLIVVMAICLIVPLVRMIMIYGALPDIIPTHFGASGEVDGYGSKWSLWILWGVDLLCCGLIVVSELFPRWINVPVFLLKRPAEDIICGTRLMMNIMGVLIAAFFWYITEVTIAIACGATAAMSGVATIGFVVALILISLIYFLWLWRA